MDKYAFRLFQFFTIVCTRIIVIPQFELKQHIGIITLTLSHISALNMDQKYIRTQTEKLSCIRKY